MGARYELVGRSPIEVERVAGGLSIEAFVVALSIVGVVVVGFAPSGMTAGVQCVVAGLGGMFAGYRTVFRAGFRRLRVVEEGGERWLVADRQRIPAADVSKVQTATRVSKTPRVDASGVRGDVSSGPAQFLVLVLARTIAIELECESPRNSGRISARLARALDAGRVEQESSGPGNSHLIAMGGVAAVSSIIAALAVFSMPPTWAPMHAAGVGIATSVALFVLNFLVARAASRGNLAARIG